MWINTHDHNRLYAQSFGNERAPALIFCNSLGTDHSMWQPQIDALSRDYRVIAYDTRGHGQSGAEGSGWELADLGQDVLSVLDGFGIEKAHFCCISMGGLTGLWLGIHAPQRLHTLIVSNTAAKIGQTEAWQQRADDVRRNGLTALADSAPARWFSPDFIAAHPDTVAALTAKLAAGHAEGYAKCCEVLAAADVRDQVSAIRVPSLIIGGSVDPVTTMDDARWLQAQIPTAQLAELPASHIANIEAAEGFTQALQGFLAA